MDVEDMGAEIPEVSTYFLDSTDAAGRATAVEALCQQLLAKRLTISQVVMSLSGYLTSTDATKRSGGTTLLVEVARGAPQGLDAGDLHHVCEFLCNRLSDWPCVEAAAAGCLALLSRPVHVEPLSDADGIAIMERFAASVQVQPLAQGERQICLKLWLTALQAVGVKAAQAGKLDLVDATIAAVDEEKDPRCLMLSFGIIQAVAKVYHSPGVDPAPLESHSEELAEVLSCYFPVTFTPPKNDPHKITRKDLEAALEAALACSPFLAKWVLPLVLEKLSSTYRPAKEDALSALTTCCMSYGREAVRPHLHAIWLALRTELMAPAIAGLMAGEELDRKRQLARSAAASLSDIIRVHGGSGGLEILVLKDSLISELHTIVGSTHLGEASAGGAASSATPTAEPGRERHVACVASILAALASSSPEACTTTCNAILPGLLPSMQQMPLPFGSSALYLLTLLGELLRGVGAAVASAPTVWVPQGEGKAAADWMAALRLDTIIALVEGLGGSSGTGSEDAEEHQLLRTLVLHYLFNLQAACAPYQLLLEDTKVSDAVKLLSSWMLQTPEDAVAGQDDQARLCSTQVVSRSEWGRKAYLQEEALQALKACLARPVVGTVASATTTHTEMASVVLEALGACISPASARVSGTPTASHLLSQALAASPQLCSCSKALCRSWVSALLQALVDSLARAPSTWDEFDKVLMLGALTTTSRHLLPLCHLPLPTACSHSFAEFAQKLLEGASCISQEHEELGQALVACVGRLVACVCEEHQRGIAVSACAAAVQYQAAAVQHQTAQQAATSPGQPGFYAAAASCAALASMLPGVLTGPSISGVVDALLSIVITQPSAGSGPNPLQKAAAVALASLLNKWQDKDGAQDAITHVVDEGLLPRARTDSGCLYGLACTARALAMQGHARATDLIKVALEVLCNQPSASSTPMLLNPVVLSASQFFHILLQPSSSSVDASGNQPSSSFPTNASQCLAQPTVSTTSTGSSDLLLGQATHARCKALWLQRTFMTCLSLFKEQQQEQQVHATALPLGAACLLRTAPLSMQLQMDPNTCVAAAVAAVRELGDQLLPLSAPKSGTSAEVSGAGHVNPSDAADDDDGTAADGTVAGAASDSVPFWTQLLHDCLHLLLSYLEAPLSKTALEQHVPQLMPCLCSLVHLPSSPAVRGSALTCLTEMLEMPYHLLHPHRQLVLKTAVQALDDDRRSVRQLAVKCRRQWGHK